MPCGYNGRIRYGHRQYNCRRYLKTSVYGGVHLGQSRQGTIHVGTNRVLCQAVGKTIALGEYYDKYWAYALSDQGGWGWVNAVFASGGSNNGLFRGVPTCSMTTRHNRGVYPDSPPQTWSVYGSRLACSVFDDPLAAIWSGSCRRSGQRSPDLQGLVHLQPHHDL